MSMLSLLAGAGGSGGAGMASLLQQFFGAQQHQQAVQNWGNLRDELPEFQQYDFGQYEDFPELERLAEAQRINSAYEEGGGEGFDARLRALSKLEGLSETGQTAQGAAERAAFQADSGMRDRAARESILAREQEMSGGNATGRRLMDQLAVSQSGADRASMNDLQNRAFLENSRMSALDRVGSMGQGLTADTQRSQSARDMINQFNAQRQDSRDFTNQATGNQQRIGQHNVGMQNVNLANQQQQANNQLLQQGFQNQAGITAGQSGQQANFGNSVLQNQQFHQGQTQQNNQFQQQQAMQGAQMVAGAAAGAFASDENKKKNVEPAEMDIQKFLDRITGVKYEYRDPMGIGRSPGEKVGFMAQDIEDTKPGESMVMDTPEGKMIDVKESISPIIAGLGNLNERLRKAGL